MNTYTVADLEKCEGAIMPCPITFNRTIKNARLHLGLSQKEFAAQLGIDFCWLSQLENCRLPIPQHHNAITDLLPKLAELAEVDLEWLQSLQMVYTPASGEPPAFIEYFQEER